MNKYVIGIVDEDKQDIGYIERVILINKPEYIHEDQVEFVTDYLEPFEQENNSSTHIDIINDVVEQIIDDIIKRKIYLLIIDYKIIVNASSLDGTDIFKKISKMIPKFPIVILSNLPDLCYDKEFVDADKVYEKKEFFKIEEDYSKQKTFNIFQNMKHYNDQRMELSAKLDMQLDKLKKDEYSKDILKDIIETENLLDEFSPQQQSTIEKTLDVNSLYEIVNLLEKVNNLLEVKTENEN